MLYFAYGSNMWQEQMIKRCGDGFRFLKVGYLKDTKLVFDGNSKIRKGAVANIVPEEGSVVWGVLYEIDDEALKELDRYEGYNIKTYDRKRVVVYDEDGNSYEDVIVYYRTGEKLGAPSKDYLDTIIRGAKENGLPDDYIRFLESFEPI